MNEQANRREAPAQVDGRMNRTQNPAQSSAVIPFPESRPNRRRRFRVLSFDELMDLPDPEWLIEGILPLGVAAEIYGPPGSKKTFTTLDWSLHVASGISWQGRKVRSGLVVYVAAEGVLGCKARTKAWTQHNGIGPRESICWVREAVPLNSASAVDDFSTQVREYADTPVLIVFDTLSRCNAGADENSSRDMSRIVDAVDRIRDAFDCTVLLVHHSGKSGESERGSNAVRAGVDVMMSVRPGNSDTFTLACEKMKDAEPFDPMSFRLRQVGGSCVLETVEGQPNAVSDRINLRIPPLRALGKSTITSTEWLRAAHPMPKTSFQRHRDWLVANGYVEKDGRQYSVTESGLALLDSEDADV